MRKLKTVVKATMLPVATIACIAWVAGFVIIGIKLPHHDIGTITLTVVGGLALMFPWLGLVMGVMRRMGSDHEESSHHDED